ncbi:hypothetical protein [uncultured Azonexus sp.]|uniref:hypothetical protein n=1 Tax=uncultured Azonexus sp. TaxID=520307 RepID=UPI0026036DF2|nr:hypothetical protein [uncultured Azonexus sp.]MCA1938456.1 hypothetical protein [Dechloromonas sp.]
MSRAVATLVLSLLTAPAWAAAGELFCCTDPASGRRICADMLPQQCRGLAYRVFDRAGNPIRNVAAPLTPEQKAAAAAEAQRKKEEEEKRLEQRRIDQALLTTYATAEDIDLAQRKAEGDVQLTIQNATAKITELQKAQRKLAEEAEFYKRKAMPPELDTKLRTVGHEIRLQQELIQLKRKELEAVRTKYDNDRQRYFQLTGRSSAQPVEP